MNLKKDNETYAAAAKRFTGMESDPSLLNGMLEQLKTEMESDPKFIKSQQQKQQGQFATGGNLNNNNSKDPENAYADYLKNPGQSTEDLYGWQNAFTDKKNYLNAILNNPQLRRNNETDDLIKDALKNKDNQLDRISKELKKKPLLDGKPVDVDAVTYANGGMINSYAGGGGMSYSMERGDPFGFRMNQQDPYVSQRYGNIQGMNPIYPYVSGAQAQSNPTQLTVGQQDLTTQSSPNNGWQDAAAFGMQSLPSIASGLTTYFGNRSLEKDAKAKADAAKDNYQKISAPRLTAQQYNLGRERASSRSQANEARASANRQVSNAARSRGEYLAGANAGATRVQQTLGNQLSQSYQREGQMNQAERSRVDAANAQSSMAAQQFNAQQKYKADMLSNQWQQQAMAYKQGQYGAITGTMQDMQQIAGQNQMISSLGDRYGYQRQNWYTPNQRNINYTGRQA